MYKTKIKLWIMALILWLVSVSYPKWNEKIEQWITENEKIAEEKIKEATPASVGIFCESEIRNRMNGMVLQSIIKYSDTNRDIIIQRSGTSEVLNGYSKVDYYSPLVLIVKSNNYDSLFENQTNSNNTNKTVRCVSLKKLLIGFENNQTYKEALDATSGNMYKKKISLAIDQDFIEETKILFAYTLYPEYKELIEKGEPLPNDVIKRINALIDKSEKTDNVFDFFNSDDNKFKVIIAPEYKWEVNERYSVYFLDTIAIDYDVWYRADIKNLEKVVNNKEFMELTGFRNENFASSNNGKMKHSCWNISCIHVE